MGNMISENKKFHFANIRRNAIVHCERITFHIKTENVLLVTPNKSEHKYRISFKRVGYVIAVERRFQQDELSKSAVASYKLNENYAQAMKNSQAYRAKK